MGSFVGTLGVAELAHGVLLAYTYLDPYVVQSPQTQLIFVCEVLTIYLIITQKVTHVVMYNIKYLSDWRQIQIVGPLSSHLHASLHSDLPSSLIQLEPVV